MGATVAVGVAVAAGAAGVGRLVGAGDAVGVGRGSLPQAMISVAAKASAAAPRELR